MRFNFSVSDLKGFLSILFRLKNDYKSIKSESLLLPGRNSGIWMINKLEIDVFNLNLLEEKPSKLRISIIKKV